MMSGDKNNVSLFEALLIGLLCLVIAVVAFATGHYVGRVNPIGTPPAQAEFWVGEGQILADGRFAFRIQEPKK